MYPFTYLLIHIVLIFLTGFIAYSSSIFSHLPLLLFIWLWFNLFIALYEFYIVYHRRRFTPEICPKDFWQEEVDQNFWFKAWLEYSCYSDTRYLDPYDSVFVIEALNGILVVLMWIALLAKAYSVVMYMLILQVANCIFYFISLYISGKINQLYSYKTSSYLFLSSWWIIVPMILIFQNL